MFVKSFTCFRYRTVSSILGYPGVIPLDVGIGGWVSRQASVFSGRRWHRAIEYLSYCTIAGFRSIWAGLSINYNNKPWYEETLAVNPSKHFTSAVHFKEVQCTCQVQYIYMRRSMLKVWLFNLGLIPPLAGRAS